MQMTKLRLFALGLPLGVALSLCVACGDDGDGGGSTATGGTAGATGGTAGAGGSNAGAANGGASSGLSLPGDKAIGSLSDSEAQQLCNEFDKVTSTGATQELACVLAGTLAAAFANPMTDAELQMACKATYDECKAAPPESTSSKCEKPNPSCVATVAEVQQCLADATQALQNLAGSLPTCAKLTLKSLESAPPSVNVAKPPSCVTLQEKCPDLDIPLTP